jgi:hypothetical protein
VAYAVWGAGRSSAALILTTGGKLSVPYRAQIERLGPDRLVRIGGAVGLLDDDEGLPIDGHDHDLVRDAARRPCSPSTRCEASSPSRTTVERRASSRSPSAG